MKRTKKLRLVTGWLLLLGIFCWVMVPSESLAKVFRTQATEGDPGDGDGIESGGASPQVVLPGTFTTFWNSGESSVVIRIQLVPKVISGKLVFTVEITKAERQK